MTAKEIRDALRKGTLDPFDKVSAEGSNIREDLIEVDEIFAEAEDDNEGLASNAPVSSTPLLTADGSSAVAMADRGRIQEQGQGQTPVTPPASFATQLPSGLNRPSPAPAQVGSDGGPRTNSSPIAAALPALSWKSSEATNAAALRDDSKSTQKRYYLIDKARILGPISALEIQSLFNRGGISPKVKVQRIGGAKAIPISQFIASFSEDRIKELTEDGKLNQKASSPSSKVLNELARAANAQKIAKDRKNRTYLILALAGFVFGAVILVILDSNGSNRRAAGEQQAGENKKGRPKLLQKSNPDAREENRVTDNTSEPPVRAKSKGVVQTKTPRAPVEVSRETKEIRRLPPPKQPVRQAQNELKQPATKVIAPKIATVSKTQPTESGSLKKEGPIARALSSGGGVQTVGPLNFAMSALEACSSKCTLTLRDNTGASIKAIFFKSAYYDQLRASSGSVFISGTVRREGSGASILIQDVR
jgi:hypothetical protein